MRASAPPHSVRSLFALVVLGIAWHTGPAGAFPPAPPHVICGMIRDELGQPLQNTSARVVFEAENGIRLERHLFPGAEPGCNYRLEIPMDYGLVGKAYLPSALQPRAGFQLKVVMGGVEYLPMEMTGNALLGASTQRTRLDLTLGIDANGDGLPDAWQKLFDANPDNVAPGADAGNGLTYRELYLTGIYAVSPEAGFDLKIVNQGGGAPQLRFLGIAGHSYQIVGSSDMTTWAPVMFRVPSEGSSAPDRQHYQVAATGEVQVETTPSEPSVTTMFYRLLLQP